MSLLNKQAALRKTLFEARKVAEKSTKYKLKQKEIALSFNISLFIPFI